MAIATAFTAWTLEDARPGTCAPPGKPARGYPAERERGEPEADEPRERHEDGPSPWSRSCSRPVEQRCVLASRSVLCYAALGRRPTAQQPATDERRCEVRQKERPGEQETGDRGMRHEGDGHVHRGCSGHLQQFHQRSLPCGRLQRSVAADRTRCTVLTPQLLMPEHLFLRDAGADHVDPIERGLGGDLLFEPLQLKAALFDAECKMSVSGARVSCRAVPQSRIFRCAYR
jgi:hypothetical protein